MGLLDNFINSLLGAFGITKARLPFKHTDPIVFKSILQQKIDAAAAADKVYLMIGCVGMRQANFLSGGIQGDEHSFYSHIVTMIMGKMAEYMRVKYPFLLNNKRVPPQAQAGEIIESEADGVDVNSFDKYMNDDYQLHIFGREFSHAEAEAILLRAYATVGEPYDYLAIAKHVFGFIPDDFKLKVCSSATVYYFEIVERPALPSAKSGFETPAQVHQYLFENKMWDFFTFNIDTSQGAHV